MRLLKLKLLFSALLIIVVVFILSSCGGDEDKNIEGVLTVLPNFEGAICTQRAEGVENVPGSEYGNYYEKIKTEFGDVAIMRYDQNIENISPTAFIVTDMTYSFLLKIDGNKVTDVIAATLRADDTTVDYTDYFTLDDGVLKITKYERFVLNVTVKESINNSYASFVLERYLPPLPPRPPTP